MFRNATMKNIKRTVRRFGRPLGHRKGVLGSELLSYIDARMLIYVPAYKWMLENKAQEQVQKIREWSAEKTVILLDYNTNEDISDPSTPLSHAAMVKAYIEGRL
jgi:chaperone required for assembly of F1-ATPase